MNRMKKKIYIIFAVSTFVCHIIALFGVGVIFMTDHEYDLKIYKTGGHLINYLHSLISDVRILTILLLAIVLRGVSIVLNYRAIKREETGALFLLIMLIVNSLVYCMILYRILLI
jgi:hypothetical protein